MYQHSGSTTKMKFVALVSGGKDSCYNILHCLKQNHELVALANLCPHDKHTQELNSFMFQTVGHDLVSLYEKCCHVPLFKRHISQDGSINRDLNYIKVSNDDEIEAMFHLLQDVKSAIPDLKGVSVGAILSSYQRVRVEDVCNRLGLTVLSYLWQRDQLELMTEMVSMSNSISPEDNNPPYGKFDARLIKVATIGLDAAHLNKSLPEILPTMIKLNQQYEVNICGEGGEFETMVLDAPFFKDGYLKLIGVNIDPQEVDNHHNHNDGVFNAHLNVEFVPRKLDQHFLPRQLESLPEPPILNDKWQELLSEVQNIPLSNETVNLNSMNTPTDCYNFNPTVSISNSTNNNLLYISNLVSTLKEDNPLESHMENILKQLNDTLNSKSLYPCQIISSSLILQDISNFTRINKIYNDWFDTNKWGPLPPSRACVGSNMLGPHNMVQLSVVIDTTPQSIITYTNGDDTVTINQNKDGLHVQSRSYWAPCNIGPYSQATWLHNDYENKVARISGQIALIPKSMELVSNNDPWTQSVLALKHFDTLKQTIDTKNQLFMTCFVSSGDMVDIVSKTWSLYCSEMSYESSLWMDKEDDPMECLVIVEISQLPRNALCEWGGVAAKSIKVEMYDDDTDSDEQEELDNTSLSHVNSSMQNVSIQEKTHSTEIFNTITVSKGEHNKRYFTTGFSNDDSELLAYLNTNVLGQITLYLNPSVCSSSVMEQLNTKDNVELYPVQKVYNHKGTNFKYGYNHTY